MSKCMRCMQDYEQLKFCPYCGAPAEFEVSDWGQIPAETILNRRFIVGDVLNHDRIGFTYLAWDALLERKVVIKEWMPVKLAEREKNHKDVKYSMSEELCKSLNREFLEQAKKLHKAQNIPMLVPIYTFFEENNTVYYVMEYTEGQTLGSLLQKENPLDYQRAGEIMKKVYQALEVLHKNSFVHGNLTPDNIFLCKNGDIKFLNQAWFAPCLQEIKYTIFLGKYAPPHYYRRPVVPDEEMDRYGAAAVYYRIITGEKPIGIYQREKGQVLPTISDYGIDIPGKTEKEILQILDYPNTKGLGILRFLQGLNAVLLIAVVVLGIFVFI